MSSGAGLRRTLLGESQTKAEDGLLGSLLDSDGKKPSIHHQQLHGSRYRPAFKNMQWVIGFVTVITISLLVIRFQFSGGVLDPAVSDAYANSYLALFGKGTARSTLTSVSSSAHPRLRLEHEYVSYSDGAGSKTVRTRNARILARDPKKTPNCVAVNGLDSTLGVVRQAYHSPEIFYQDFVDMVCQFKIFVYPYDAEDPFASIFRPDVALPTGNYASEHYFKMALLNSDLLTEDPAEADLFYMPFSIANMRGDPRIGVEGIKHFVKDYVGNISVKYPYWERSSGADHFYVNCHSIGKTATEEAVHVRLNAIQVVCSSSYHIPVFYPHKDASIPQVWPRTGFPEQAPSIEQRTTLAFFAGAGNSPIRALVAKYWVNDTEIKVYTSRINTPYDVALLTSKFCLHVKGFEVNTARLADAMHYGCVPIIIADYHDLPYNDVLDWKRFSLVVTHADIPKLKDIVKAVSDEEYVEMQKTVMQVRQHFQWHKIPEHFDAFYTVMYELWLRRHVARFQFS